MADAGSKTPKNKSWADVEEEEAKAVEAASRSSSKTEPVVEAQTKHIEALSLVTPEEEAGAEDLPLLNDFEDSQIQAVCSCRHPCPCQPLALVDPHS
jgi:hypothetical protein